MTAVHLGKLYERTRFGVLDAPHIIAVNTIEQHLVLEDVMEALFGKEVIEIVARRDGQISEPRYTRVPDGAWIAKTGPVNTRVSAALIGCCLNPWTIADSPIQMYHNPWTTLPSTEILSELPSYSFASGKPSFRDGVTFRDLAGFFER